MERNCLNCLYEPTWGKWVGNHEYRRQIGTCKFKIKLPVLPATYHIREELIIKYSDDSGVMINCKAWKAKESSKETLITP